MSDDFKLIGFLDLAADYAGFVDPVFLGDGERAIQRVGADGDTVSHFDIIASSLPVALKANGDEVCRVVGERRLFAFRFPDQSIACGDRDQLAQALRSRFFELYTGRSATIYPLLILDVLSFLGDEDAVFEELDYNRSPAAFQKYLARSREHLALLQLSREDFKYAALSGRLHFPTRETIINIDEASLRRLLAQGVRKLATRRLWAVFALLCVLAVVIFSDKLIPLVGITPAALALGFQVAGTIAVFWLFLELILGSGKLSRRQLVPWLVVRIREAARKA
ncbi:MAG: hypothetical protein GC191_04425 [Azospirillum sp.]|nr:hypothetical protein [Azospirillum sp.]